MKTKAAIRRIPDEAAIVTRAALRAADQLGLRNNIVARVIGVSEPTLSRMRSGDYRLSRDQKPFELAVLFVRLYRSLDAIVDGDSHVAQSWMRNENTALNGRPLELIQTVAGLNHVIQYLELPAALSDSARRAAGTGWRVIEAQHRVSTLKITDSLAEQELLETLIEATKPAVPPECRHLHYLLSTPFRYGAPYPTGSRFRRAGFTPGVFYAAHHVETAIAEAAFWRLLFYADSPDTPWPANAGEYTAFAIRYATVRGIDLTQPPFERRKELWMHPTRLDACQALAETARTANIDVIRYASVRDPQHRMNVALLRCRAFSKSAETSRQTWRIQFGASGVRARCEMPRLSVDFDRRVFAGDPRILGMKWERGI